MNPECYPVKRRGDRNVFCPYYGECLDYVIFKRWEYWNCACCAYRFDERAAPEIPWRVNHSIAYYEPPEGI